MSGSTLASLFLVGASLAMPNQCRSPSLDFAWQTATAAYGKIVDFRMEFGNREDPHTSMACSHEENSHAMSRQTVGYTACSARRCIREKRVEWLQQMLATTKFARRTNSILTADEILAVNRQEDGMTSPLMKHATVFPPWTHSRSLRMMAAFLVNQQGRRRLLIKRGWSGDTLRFQSGIQIL